MKNTNISNPAEKWVSDTNHEKIEELKLVSLETIISHNIFHIFTTIIFSFVKYLNRISNTTRVSFKIETP